METKLFADGDGTETNPYQIKTAEQLQNLNSVPSQNKHYVLINNIDLTKYLSEDGNDNGQGWIPILHFHGSFDGKGYKISGLWINRPSKHDIGLFLQALEGTVIKNLGVEIDNSKGGVKGNEFVGGLVGLLNGTISNCHVTGNVSGSKIVGGLVGSNGKESTIRDSYTTGNIMGNGDYVGGLIGQNFGTVIGSYATGSVIGGNNNVGGLVGLNASGTISDSYATGNVTGGNCVGGLVASNGSEVPKIGRISNCYATGNISGNQIVGGIVGINSGEISSSYAIGNVSGNNIANIVNTAVGGLAGINTCRITDSYATGSVAGIGGNGRFVGGFIGANMGGKNRNCYTAGKVIGTGDSECFGSLAGVNGEDGTFDNCYCDTQISGISSRAGRTTAEMKTKSTYEGWDFEKIWKINPAENNGYPTLIRKK